MTVPLFDYVLRLADNALVLGHRLSEWCGHGPVLEEDLALANMALDLIGQSRSLYDYAGEVGGRGHDEDALAYLRDVASYRNVLLVEQPNGDFACTMARQFFYSAFMHPYWQAMAASSDPALAAIAEKSVKEVAYHVRHTSEWAIRLGDGTEESHRRMQAAVDELWPYTGELFEADAIEAALIEAGIATDPRPLEGAWRATVANVLKTATLTLPATGWMQTGGRVGRHSEHLGHLLADLQYMQRAYPGAAW
ncbi:MAG: phenylacetate-CoA oxygenase subunit PaaI [Alphaproteobacteria bacterium]|nr:phenylacetate-CoA oxygenase subunit PaaI [Alphaproteobacteria bacterium]